MLDASKLWRKAGNHGHKKGAIFYNNVLLPLFEALLI